MRPQLLAPAGTPAALRAAASAGADAVYLGLRTWSARAFAGNFDAPELLRAIDVVHRFGADVHLTLNTLLKDGEIGPALAALEAPYAAGVDAVLVADLGLAAAVRDAYPDLPLHASTQLNTHSSAQLALLERLGFRRAVLARELSLEEIRSLAATGLELEVFVHGALCYGYSGACLFSSMIGGRSGNRGRCAQACRMRYALGRGEQQEAATVPAVADTAVTASAARDAAVTGRVLSTADLCALDALPALLRAGVTSFKIEGRMKDAAYVATAVSVYREALDAALDDPAGYSVREEWMARLEQSFSRTFTGAHLAGRHAEVRSGGRGGHRGVPVGRVVKVDEDTGRVEFRLTRPLDAGDVVCVYTSRGQTGPVTVTTAGRESLSLVLREQVSPKDRLFRLSAARDDESARELVSGRAVVRPIPLRARLRARVGAPAHLRLDCRDFTAETESSADADPARAAPLTGERARAAIGALGGTPYRLTDFEFDLAPGLFLPVSELKDMRRRALAVIDDARLAARRRAAPSPARARIEEPAAAHPSRRGGEPAGAHAVVLRVSPEESPLPAPGVEAVCIDCEVEDEPRVIAAALAGVLAYGLPVRCRPPQILFDADMDWWDEVRRLRWTAVYARHAAHLAFPGDLIFEYPLIGLTAAGPSALAAFLTAAPPPVDLRSDPAGEAGSASARPAGLPKARRLAGVVAPPELSLDELRAYALRLAGLRPAPVLEALVVGREQLLLSRDRLGEAEGITVSGAGGPTQALCLEDARGYRFPVRVSSSGTQVLNSVPTDLTAQLAELAASGVGAAVVQQRELTGDVREAFARDGLPGLVRLGRLPDSTTGHLFRGVP